MGNLIRLYLITNRRHPYLYVNRNLNFLKNALISFSIFPHIATHFLSNLSLYCLQLVHSEPIRFTHDINRYICPQISAKTNPTQLAISTNWKTEQLDHSELYLPYKINSCTYPISRYIITGSIYWCMTKWLNLLQNLFSYF